MELTLEQELDIRIFEERLKALDKAELVEVAEMLYRQWMVREGLLKQLLVGSK
jgi:Phycobilisome degradation protein nblA